MLRRQIALDRQYRADVDWRQPDRYKNLFDIARDRPISVQGSGLSIAACSFGKGARVVNMRRFDRLLAFDPERRVLDVEAGASIGEISAFLTPRGFWLAVQPGYPDITVGGCIAGNVHGKNQYRDGCFSRHVQALRLFHPDYGVQELNADNYGEIFDLTCGGFGLTGIIVSATLRVEPLPEIGATAHHVPVSNLTETVARLIDLKDDCDVLYSWNDLARFGPDMGRGYVVAGNFTAEAGHSRRRRPRRRIDPNARRWRPRLLNNLTLRPFNTVYYHATRRGPSRPPDLEEILYPWLSKAIYFDIIGEAGVIEPQVLVPMIHLESYLGEYEALIRQYRQPLAIVSLKLFRGDQRLLRYEGEGISFSVQLPATERTERLLDALDALNVRYGAITNLIKDSRLRPETARAQYSEFDVFASRLRAFDSKRRFSTALSERLGL